MTDLAGCVTDDLWGGNCISPFWPLLSLTNANNNAHCGILLPKPTGRELLFRSDRVSQKSAHESHSIPVSFVKGNRHPHPG